MVMMDANQTRHRVVSERIAELVIASLSTEPETIAELELGMRRFVRSATRAMDVNKWIEGDVSHSRNREVCYVDLAARLIVSTCRSFRPDRRGSVAYVEEPARSGRAVQYRIPDDWLISDVTEVLILEGPERRKQRLLELGRNARDVLYNEVGSFVAHECLDGNRYSESEDPVAEIHKKWLTTSRQDLDNLSPRSVLLEKVDFIDGDLSDRASQWSRIGCCPDGIGEESYAFQFGGFGTHEIVLYYDLVRSLICECWDRSSEEIPSRNGRIDHQGSAGRIASLEGIPPASVMTERSIETEIYRLEQSKKEWLETPQKDLHGKSPEEVVLAERARIPVTVSPDEMVLDCDCPLCQWLVDNDHGPTFLHLDNSHMDWDFEFSFCSDRQEWEESVNRLSFECADATRDSDLEYNGTNRFELDGDAHVDDERNAWLRNNSIWNLSGSDPAIFHPDLNSGEVAIISFAVGAHVSELKLDLKANNDDSLLADELSKQFASLITVLKDEKRRTKNKVIARFCSVLNSISESRQDLSEKCADLESRLVRLMD